MKSRKDMSNSYTWKYLQLRVSYDKKKSQYQGVNIALQWKPFPRSAFSLLYFITFPQSWTQHQQFSQQLFSPSCIILLNPSQITANRCDFEYLSCQQQWIGIVIPRFDDFQILIGWWLTDLYLFQLWNRSPSILENSNHFRIVFAMSLWSPENNKNFRDWSSTSTWPKTS